MATSYQQLLVQVRMKSLPALSSTVRPIVSQKYCASAKTELTIRKKPSVFNDTLITVTNNSIGREAFRVDSTGPRNEQVVLLKDSAGTPLLTMRPKVTPKYVSSELTLGKDVFSMEVEKGFDQAFIVAVIVILERMNGGDKD
eukprot:Gb_26786 [translate_table: standard]